MEHDSLQRLKMKQLEAQKHLLSKTHTHTHTHNIYNDRTAPSTPAPLKENNGYLSRTPKLWQRLPEDSIARPAYLGGLGFILASM